MKRLLGQLFVAAVSASVVVAVAVASACSGQPAAVPAAQTVVTWSFPSTSGFLAGFVRAHRGLPLDAPMAIETSRAIDPASVDAGVVVRRADGSLVDVDRVVTLGG